MNIPTISIPEQSPKAFVCVVNAAHQGVVEYENISEIRPNHDEYGTPILEIWMPDNMYSHHHYKLDDVWGAWFDWPHIEIRYGNKGMIRRGPEYFQEFTWAPWEWVNKDGAKVKFHGPNPFKNSIWCDSSDTESDPMTTSVRSSNNKFFTNGWIRKDRISKEKRVESFHYPHMP